MNASDELVTIRLYDTKLVRARRTLRLPVDRVLSQRDAGLIFRHALADADRERLAVLHLDQTGNVLGLQEAHVGNQGSLSLDPRIVLRGALIACAARIILGHNHLSGDVNPSPEDITTTRRMAIACRAVGLSLLDHLIVTHRHERFVNMASSHPSVFAATEDPRTLESSLP